MNPLILCATTRRQFRIEAWYAESQGWPWIPNHEIRWEPIETFDHYAGPKIGIVNVFMTTNYEDCHWADLVIGYNPETVTTNLPPDQFINLLKLKTRCSNVIVIAGGVPIHWIPHLPHPRVYSPTLGCFDQVCMANGDIKLNYKSTRSFLFEAMLGQSSIPRQWLSAWIQNSNFFDQTLLSISASHGSEHFYRSPALHALDHPVISQSASMELKGNAANLTMPDRKYFNLTVPANQFIPTAIYENSWFSIVSETDASGSLFFTEKLGKVLYGQRIFVLFGAPGALACLKKLGYKTFNGLIDESYDEIANDRERWLRAWNTVCDMAKMDPKKLYIQANDILIHNAQLIKNIEHRHRPIQNFISNWLNYK